MLIAILRFVLSAMPTRLWSESENPRFQRNHNFKANLKQLLAASRCQRRRRSDCRGAAVGGQQAGAGTTLVQRLSPAAEPNPAAAPVAGGRGPTEGRRCCARARGPAGPGRHRGQQAPGGKSLGPAREKSAASQARARARQAPPPGLAPGKVLRSAVPGHGWGTGTTRLGIGGGPGRRAPGGAGRRCRSGSAPAQRPAPRTERGR